MEKLTLKFRSLTEMALFARKVSSGYIMNTINFTLTGKFPSEQIELAVNEYNAITIETTEKVFSY